MTNKEKIGYESLELAINFLRTGDNCFKIHDQQKKVNKSCSLREMNRLYFL